MKADKEVEKDKQGDRFTYDSSIGLSVVKEESQTTKGKEPEQEIKKGDYTKWL